MIRALVLLVVLTAGCRGGKKPSCSEVSDYDACAARTDCDVAHLDNGDDHDAPAWRCQKR